VFLRQRACARNHPSEGNGEVAQQRRRWEGDGECRGTGAGVPARAGFGGGGGFYRSEDGEEEGRVVAKEVSQAGRAGRAKGAKGER
jgi:hypothetical protein